MDRYVHKKISPAAWNIIHWLKWISMDDISPVVVEVEEMQEVN
jgi:hypothetical protein